MKKSASIIANPTTKTMDNGEPPDDGEVPRYSRLYSRPLEHMAEEVELGAGDDDLALPPTNIGRPPPYNHELFPELLRKAKEALGKIHSYHLQAAYDAGCVRQVDRIMAELFMAQFARVNQMIGEDLNTSLQELFSVVEESSKTLLEELKTTLGPTVSNLVPYNLQRVVEAHNSHLYISLT